LTDGVLFIIPQPEKFATVSDAPQSGVVAWRTTREQYTLPISFDILWIADVSSRMARPKASPGRAGVAIFFICRVKVPTISASTNRRTIRRIT
jgi:hypothetical protein